jgi:HAD superfamily hydrolase (TIGR01490 family)
MALALFDLDNTLIAGDSDHGWGEFLCRHKYVDVDSYRERNDAFYEDYNQGRLDIRAYQQFALSPLAGKDMATLQAWHNQFMDEVIRPIMLPAADELLNKHRQADNKLVIITSTNRFVTEPVARALGVDILLATEPEIIDGVYTGNIVGEPCYQEGKVIRLQEWMQQHNENLDGSFFYSDSHNDLPLLEQVEHPVVVDADDTLLNIARERGWEIMSLR